MSEHTTWPLWMCISPESLAKLFAYQWEKYGCRLEILSFESTFKPNYPTLEQIDKEMRKPPEKQKRVT